MQVTLWSYQKALKIW